ncbi:E3 ubiquitin-protein ligase UHRF2-like isoform X1, partial [Clarias magur]
MTAEKLSRIFQVSANTVYLTDDSNVALFPGGVSGVFSTLDLTPKGHYEVHGEDMDLTPAGSTSQRFAFMRTPAAASAGSASQRVTPSPSTATKTFQRSVYLAEVVGGRLIPNRMVVVRFLECEASLQGIVGKVQDAIGNYNPIILTDAQGNAILESEGTTGSQYWKQNARKILAVPEQDFNSLQGTKRKRLSSRKDDDTAGLGEVSDKIEELVMASQNLPAVTAAIKELTDLAVTQRVYLTAPKLQTIKEGFSCVVCR